MILPDWCEHTRGTSAILLIAPHGGRRPALNAAAPPPRLRVNDLYTAEMTRALAGHLHASTVINFQQDRNTLDLNRVSQVRRHAAWFLSLLHAQIERILQHHPSAEVWFIHGWNIGQPKCDVGIGAVETAGGLQVPDGAGLTISEGYLHGRLAALRAGCAAAGIVLSVGAKYPASHHNNVLQLFGGQAAQDDPRACDLAAWMAAGRVNALQLELGIPLRWPGEWRERFLDVIVQACGPEREPQSQHVGAGPRACPDVSEAVHPRGGVPAALQFYDPAADLGLLSGLGRMGPATLAGRLLLFLGGQRIALFTGEGRLPADLGLVLDGDATSLRLQFHGPMLILDDAALYVDLEAALAASRLGVAEVDLHFAAAAAAGNVQFGTVEGRVILDGVARTIRTGAFANAGSWRAMGASGQTMLAADFGAGRGFLSRVTEREGRSMAVDFAAGTARSLDGTRLVLASDGAAECAGEIELYCDGAPPLRARPLSRMAILRPAGDAGYLRVSFGTARFEWAGVTGWGLYEHAEPVSVARRA